jgi:hypothetical protein
MGQADEGTSAAVIEPTKRSQTLVCLRQLTGEEVMAKKTSAGRNGSNGKRYSAPARNVNKSAAKPAVKTIANNVKTTAVRNTAIPKTNLVVTPVASKRTITHELIAERAYYISISGNGGSQDENWIRAERELRAGV